MSRDDAARRIWKPPTANSSVTEAKESGGSRIQLTTFTVSSARSGQVEYSPPEARVLRGSARPSQAGFPVASRYRTASSTTLGMGWTPPRIGRSRTGTCRAPRLAWSGTGRAPSAPVAVHVLSSWGPLYHHLSPTPIDLMKSVPVRQEDLVDQRLLRVHRSVGNPADSRPRLIVAHSNLALGLRAASWLPSCCMDHDALRARIRQLIASGQLPPVPPPANGTLSGSPVRMTRIVVGRSMPEPCLICGEANPTLAYTYANGRVLRLHGACDALWRQEREAEG